MPRWGLALLGLAAAAGAVKLAAPRPSPRPLDSLSLPEPGELRTSDQIVFDTLAWTPSCTEVYKYIEGNPGFLRGRGVLNKDVCKNYTARAFDAVHGGGGNSSALRIAAALPPKPIYFLHVSKSAGTFMCSCGNDNGHNPGLHHDLNQNCHFLWEDRQSWGSESYIAQKSTCESLEKQYRDHGITLEGNENYLSSGGRPCSQFETALIMRSPLHRLASNIAQLQSTANESKDGGFPPGKDAATLTLDEIYTRWPRLANNYFARSLMDTSIFYAALDALPESLLEDAKRVMMHFDHVFVAAPDLSAELGRVFNWQCHRTKGRSNTRPGGTQSIVDSWKKAWPQEDWQLLEKRNAVDIQLFWEAQWLSAVQKLRGFAAAAS